MSDVQCEHLSGDENERTINWCDLERSDSVLANGDVCDIGSEAPLMEGVDECSCCCCCCCWCCWWACTSSMTEP